VTETTGASPGVKKQGGQFGAQGATEPRRRRRRDRDGADTDEG